MLDNTFKSEYDPQNIERRAQDYWKERHSFEVDESSRTGPKFYCLSMFPYPSGKLHMGHVRNYVICDLFARYHHQLGKKVLQPFGWDSFGLPAENAALQHKVPPASWTYDNIAQMHKTIDSLGLAIDWRREITTCDPSYYRWEQWLFLKMYERGLAYRKEATVNWDPVDQTVLANEQVIDGRGWRSGAEVERRKISQWFLKITDYASELLKDLDQLTAWPKEVIAMQRNWIGYSEGAEVYFKIQGEQESLTIYTTRLDTLMGVSYLAIAFDHPLAKKAAQQDPAINAWLTKLKNLKVAEKDLATLPKEGMLTPFVAEHPITKAPLPVLIANFVLMEYGAGAVMSVPAHDKRDYEFAKKYHLPIKPVIRPADADTQNLECFTDYGVLFNSGEFDGLSSKEAKIAILQALEIKGAGKAKQQFRLRDWGISRQRYWGTPIPIIYCDKCGAVGVPEADLPVVLPTKVQLLDPRSPLKQLPEFYVTTCPKCGGPAHRETDTFDTFMESSWYFLRYASHNCTNAILDYRAEYWQPVDLYIGGIEHAILHLLYARFIHKVLRDLGFKIGDEPFKQLLTQGMVLKDGAKMSKSKGNVVEPSELIERYGVDTVRLFIIFAAPPEQSLEWSQSGVEGSYRFLKKLYNFARGWAEHAVINAPELALNSAKQHSAIEAWNQLLSQVNRDLASGHLNTLVSGTMKMLNLLTSWNDAELAPLVTKGLKDLLRVLYPVVPHITHYLWQELNFGEDIGLAGWPQPEVLEQREAAITIIVQVNGKLRAKLMATKGSSRERVTALALELDTIKQQLDGRKLQQVIWVPDRLINLVVT